MNKVSIIPQDDAPVMAIPQVPAATSLLHVLGRAMSDPSIDVEKVERYAALYERAIAREDEIAFNQAMMQAQSEMRPIAAKANNPQTKSKYAKYEAVDAEARPIYTKHGFSLSFYTGEGAPEGSIRVQCKVSRGGHTERPYIDMPADGKGAKGGDVMTKTHATGAGVTYGRRYLLGMIFNLVIGNDDDGNSANVAVDNTPPPAGAISEKQADNIRELLEAREISLAAFLNWVKQKRICDIPADQYDGCITGINNFRKAGK
jgi:hypothetical protein